MVFSRLARTGLVYLRVNPLQREWSRTGGQVTPRHGRLSGMLNLGIRGGAVSPEKHRAPKMPRAFAPSGGVWLPTPAVQCGESLGAQSASITNTSRPVPGMARANWATV